MQTDMAGDRAPPALPSQVSPDPFCHEENEGDGSPHRWCGFGLVAARASPQAAVHKYRRGSERTRTSTETSYVV